MTLAARFLIVWSRELPPEPWVVDTLRKAASQPGALAESTTDRRPLIRQMLEAIGEADLVIAEVSGDRPDIYYLCGLAHARRLPVLLLAHESSRTHFNLSAYPVQRYASRADITEAIDTAVGEANVRRRAAQRTAAEAVASAQEQRNARRLAILQEMARRLPRCVSRSTVTELRALLGVKPLPPARSDIDIEEVTSGTYGYTWTASLSDRIEDFLRIAVESSEDAGAGSGRASLRLSSAQAMAHVEVAKAPDGTVYLVAADTGTVELDMAAAPSGAVVAVSVHAIIAEDAASHFWAQRLRKEGGRPLAIPVLRIRRAASRTTREGTVLDLSIDCC